MPKKKYEFEGKIISADGGGAYVEFPYDVEKEFGIKGQVKIKAKIDGEPYRGSLANMGTGCHILIVLKKIREKIGKDIGDKVHAEIVQDTEERVVKVPADLQKLLNKNKKAKTFFESASFTTRKEYVNWIESAKREETRISRLEKTIAKLSVGEKLS